MVVSKYLCWQCFDMIVPCITATIVASIDAGVTRRIEPGGIPCARCGEEATVEFKKEIK